MKNKSFLTIIFFGICAVAWIIIAVHEITIRTKYDYSIAWLVANVIVAIIWILAFLMSIKRYFSNNSEEKSAQKIEVPLTNIQQIDEAGILFIDSDGCSMNIPYYESYKSWCREAAIRKSKSKYICDIKESDEGNKIIFYYNPQIIFHVNSDEKELLICFEEQIINNGFRICRRLCEEPCK